MRSITIFPKENQENLMGNLTACQGCAFLKPYIRKRCNGNVELVIFLLLVRYDISKIFIALVSNISYAFSSIDIERCKNFNNLPINFHYTRMRPWDKRPSDYRKCCRKCLKKYEWWEPPEDSLSFDYCRNTGLHGLKYIGQKDRHIVERIFWLIAFLSGLVVAVILIQDVFHKYRANPVIVSFQPYETQIETIPFPAVTICNMNKVLKSKALKIKADWDANVADKDGVFDESVNSDYNFLEHVCYAEKSFSMRFYKTENATISAQQDLRTKIPKMHHSCSDCTHGADVKEFLKQASQPCEDMLKLCVWEEEPVECTQIFKPLETDYGKCCVFNLVPPTLLDTLQNDTRDDPLEVHEWAKWDVRKKGIFLHQDYSFEYPRRQRRAGKTYGLSILLNPNLDEYFCSASDSNGFRMAANLPIEFPQVTDFGIAMRADSEVFVGIRPDIVMSEAAIASSPLEKRECYFQGEFPLEYYNFYTASNCINECIANETFTLCNCVTYFMPRDGGRKLCDAKDFTCVSKAKRNFTKNGKKAKCSQCLPACTEIRYLTDVTETPLLALSHGYMTYGDHANIRPVSNASIVHVYFAQDATYARVRKELYGITDLIASTGGLMGLCLGFSGLSLVELVYFLTIRACCRAKRRSKPGKSALQQIRKKLDVWTGNKIVADSQNLEKQPVDIYKGPYYMWELNPKFQSVLPMMKVQNEHNKMLSNIYKNRLPMARY